MQLTRLQELMLDESLHELELPVRIINALETHAQVFTVKDLLMCTKPQLLELPNFGEKTLTTIYEALEKIGFYRDGHPNASKTFMDNEARRKRLRDALGGTAADDWEAEIISAKSRARKRKKRDTQGDE